MDGNKIWEQREKTEEWLSGAYFWAQHFVKTSENPGWQGKVKCRYCKRNGWPDLNRGQGTGQANAKWWGDKHGQNCKWKELYDLKRRQPVIGYGSGGVGGLSYNTISNSLWVNIGSTSTTTGTYTIPAGP